MASARSRAVSASDGAVPELSCSQRAAQAAGSSTSTGPAAACSTSIPPRTVVDPERGAGPRVRQLDQRGRADGQRVQHGDQAVMIMDVPVQEARAVERLQRRPGPQHRHDVAGPLERPGEQPGAAAAARIRLRLRSDARRRPRLSGIDRVFQIPKSLLHARRAR